MAKLSYGRRPSSVVIRPQNPISRKPKSRLAPNFVERHLCSLGFSNIKVWLFINCFIISLTWDHIECKISTTPPLKVHKKFITPKSRIVPGKGSKLFSKEWWMILEFWRFLFVFANIGLYGRNVLHGINSERTYHIHFPIFIYTPSVGLYQRICEISYFAFLAIVFCSFYTLGPLPWRSIGIYKMCDIFKTAGYRAKRTNIWT